MMRDFTYIDDIVDGIKKVINDPAKPDAKWNSESPKPSSSLAPYRILNLGNNNPIPLNEFIKAIEEATEKDAIIEYLPMQPGDVEKTYANIDKMKHLYNFKPATSIRKGINNFVDWYTSYHG